MRRVGAIDLGTNSTRLLIADVEEGRLVREIDRRLTITRLGQGVDARRALLAKAVQRVHAALADYRVAAERQGAERVLAIATSAVRDAANGEAFLHRIEQEFGFRTRLLSGDEEALLTFRGVQADRVLPPETLVLDVGGGSTELVLGSGTQVGFHLSLDLGCVRLTERFLAGDPRSEEEVARARAQIRVELERQVPANVRPERVVGVAGTVTTLAALDLGLESDTPRLVHGHLLTAAAIETQLAHLLPRTVSQLSRTRGIHPDRAPVLLGGILVVAETLAFFGLAGVRVSAHDILDGAALSAAELPDPG